VPHHVGDLKRVALLVEHQRRETVAEVVGGCPCVRTFDLAVDLGPRDRSDPDRLARWLPYALSPVAIRRAGPVLAIVAGEDQTGVDAGEVVASTLKSDIERALWVFVSPGPSSLIARVTEIVFLPTSVDSSANASPGLSSL
jgi:hypothetical protein